MKPAEQYVHVQSSFSIKDLENLSGIKAHTIRIWEKRYGLLSPSRTDGNYRVYDEEGLRKLLNIAYLNKHGIKISTIASLEEEEIQEKVESLASEGDEFKHVLDRLKLSMYAFDQGAFESLYAELRADYSFDYIYKKVFIPLLIELGMLWQNDSICPAHEHFISHLIRQKMLVAIDELPLPDDTSELYTLFLPENEVHETGLMYLHYHLKSKGKNCIYLGPSVGLSHLKLVVSSRPNLHHHFYSLLTTKPAVKNLDAYLKSLGDHFDENRCTFHFGGRIIRMAELQSEGMVKTFDLNSIIN